MSKLTTLVNRVFVSAVFLLTGTRVVAARMVPAPPPATNPPSAKVFALTEAEWVSLRAGAEAVNQESKGADEKKQNSKEAEEKKESSKSKDDGNSKSKSDCAKDANQKGTSPSPDDKECKPDESGPGGGDGDTGGGGG